MSSVTACGRRSQKRHTLGTAVGAVYQIGVRSRLSGRMRVTMDDGTTHEIGPGEVMAIPPGDPTRP
jgi:hypothetical protein